MMKLLLTVVVVISIKTMPAQSQSDCDFEFDMKTLVDSAEVIAKVRMLRVVNTRRFLRDGVAKMEVLDLLKCNTSFTIISNKTKLRVVGIKSSRRCIIGVPKDFEGLVFLERLARLTKHMWGFILPNGLKGVYDWFGLLLASLMYLICSIVES